MSTLLALTAFGAEASKGQANTTITVHRVAQINNMDKDLPFKKDRADFFAEIWIDGQYHKTTNFSDDDGEPMWVFSAPTSNRIVEVKIRLWDDDGGLENHDDHVDINPNAKEKDLVFQYDTQSKTVVGNIYGVAERGWLYSEGKGDMAKGRIWFTIS